MWVVEGGCLEPTPKSTSSCGHIFHLSFLSHKMDLIIVPAYCAVERMKGVNMEKVSGTAPGRQ